MNRKRKFLKIVKREKHKDLKYHLRYMGFLFDLFSKNPLCEVEEECFNYLVKEMSPNQVYDMLKFIMNQSVDYMIDDALNGNLVIFKYLVILYIQQLRYE
jgi:hypothetical protein